MRTTFSLPLAVLLVVAGTTAAQTWVPDALDAPSQPLPSQGLPAPPMEPLPVAPSQLEPPDPPPAADSGTMVDMQACPKGTFCNKLWCDVEYLLWFTKDNQLPPVLTQGSTSDTNPGALGQPGTNILYGGDVGNGLRSGVRIRGGYWFGDDHLFGVDDTVFILAPTTNTFTDSSGANTLLALPYTDVILKQPGATILSYPGQSAATFTASVKNFLYGGDTDLRMVLCRTSWVQASVMAGIRYLQLDESLDITTDVTSPATNPIPGAGIVASSAFSTKNEFYGGQIGSNVAFFYRSFFLDLNAKLAFGANFESAGINGNTQVNVPGINPLTYPTGTLALPSNIGSYSHTVFTVVPEGMLNLGYQFNKYVRATIGYTFLYTTHALRPGDVLDTSLNPTVASHALFGTPVVGASRPVYPGTDSNFWAQGATAGLEFRY
jgi:hypothetical protein